MAVFGFSPIAPAFYRDDAASNLPACCRRLGAPHCSTVVGAIALAEAPFGARLKGVCSSYGHTPAVSASPLQNLKLFGASHAVGSSVASHPAPAAQPLSLLRIALSQSLHKRGPPRLIL